MVLVITSRGLLRWENTSQQIRNNWSVYHSYVRGCADVYTWDFGLGHENAYRCGDCGRYCPVETSTIDHIVPRSRITATFVDRAYNSFEKNSNGYFIRTKGQLTIIPHNVSEPYVRMDYYIDRNRREVVCYEKDYSAILSGDDTIKPTQIRYRFQLDEVLENALDNLEPMCAHCNSRKGNR